MTTANDFARYAPLPSKNLGDFDAVDFITSWEGAGDHELSKKEIIDGFQHLIDSGLCWKLQGRYGFTALCLIDAGYCVECNGK